MPPELATPEAPPESAIPANLDVLPESVRAAAPKQNLEAEVDKFFTKPSAPAAPKPPAAQPAAQPPAEPGVKPKTETLADKLAARAAKPKVPAEGAKPDAKPSEAPAPEGQKSAAQEAKKNPEDELDLDTKASTAARENFAKLRSITKGVRDQLINRDRELTELRTKLEAASKAPTSEQLARLESLEKEHKALSDRLLLIDTQNHPQFKAQYVAPREAALATAKELLEANGVQGADLNKLLAMPRGDLGKAVSEIVKTLPDLDRSEVSQAVLQAWKLNQAGDAALKNASQTYQGIRQHTVEQQKQLFNSQFERLTAGHQVAKLEIPADASAEVRAEYEAFNKDAESIRTHAEQIALEPTTEDRIVEHAMKVAAYDFHLKHVQPKLLAAINDRNEVIARLTSELEGFRARNPNRQIAPIPGGQDATPASKPDSIEGVADRFFKS